ncbi:hypothetical protein N9830_02295 [Akkermansiaceae bacterium]|nr:hypothetical protein [Akkermansiaceae bacterium]MDB4277228.1 hypothetical protein [bacterium]MDA7518973.1 hypothetical protein [Akkermansiaceae bacterium]MDA8960324.1 hypothetical protein [Akkermansiaceae bacterium]MDB4041325.1 hypothetical protein [Akkermansiaceae bacterium]
MHTSVLLSTTGGSENVTALFLLLLTLSLVAVWVWSIFHCLFNNRLDSTKKIIGVVLIMTLAHLGSLIYFFLPWNNEKGAPLQT